jgi:hypothetical protein
MLKVLIRTKRYETLREWLNDSPVVGVMWVQNEVQCLKQLKRDESQKFLTVAGSGCKFLFLT